MELGKIQTLTIVKETDFGVYLSDSPQSEEKVLLPAKQVPENAGKGDKVTVFLYRDSKDRLIATTKMPKLTLGGIAALKTVQVTGIGAFLDWGLEKDLFLPYKEQSVKVRFGDTVLVRLYVDKSDRLCASMRGLYHYLSTRSPYQPEDIVEGRVYEFGRDYGTFVAVDDRYSAMIPRYEDTSALHIGDVIKARVTGVKEDGKLDLSLRQKAYLQINEDAEAIYQLIVEYGGVLPFNDKASPETIKREAHMSKNAFKRAVGHLYKERRIGFTEKGIRLTGKENI